MLACIEGDYLYEIHMLVPPVSATYNFRSRSTLLDHGNPFFAVMPAEVPQLIHALLVLSDEVVAFSGSYVYLYNRTSLIWTQLGPAYCP